MEGLKREGHYLVMKTILVELFVQIDEAEEVAGRGQQALADMISWELVGLQDDGIDTLSGQAGGGI